MFRGKKKDKGSAKKGATPSPAATPSASQPPSRAPTEPPSPQVMSTPGAVPGPPAASPAMSTPHVTPTATGTAPALPPAASGGGAHAVSQEEYLAMQLRNRTQLRVVLTEVAREERRTTQLSAKIREVKPSMQAYKQQVAALQRQLAEGGGSGGGGDSGGPAAAEVAALARVLQVEVAREERRTSQLTEKMKEMRPTLMQYSAQIKALQAPPPSKKAKSGVLGRGAARAPAALGRRGPASSPWGGSRGRHARLPDPVAVCTSPGRAAGDAGARGGGGGQGGGGGGSGGGWRRRGGRGGGGGGGGGGAGGGGSGGAGGRSG